MSKEKLHNQQEKTGTQPSTAAPANPESAQAPATEVAKAEPGPLPAVAEASIEEMFEEDAGHGLMDIGAQDCVMPFFSILQKGSPQVSRANAKYIKGAEQGMIFNTVTGEIFQGEMHAEDPNKNYGILFIPCGFKSEVVRWKSRDSGGGLVCVYSTQDPILKSFKKNERGQLYDEKSGDVLIDTHYHIGVMVPESGFPELGVVSMYSSGLRASRLWNTTQKKVMKRSSKTGKMFNPPSYAYVYRLSTVPMTKDKYDWYTWRVDQFAEVTDVEIYKACRKLEEAVHNGLVRVSAPAQQFEEVAGESTDGDEVPF